MSTAKRLQESRQEDEQWQPLSFRGAYVFERQGDIRVKKNPVSKRKKRREKQERARREKEERERRRMKYRYGKPR